MKILIDGQTLETPEINRGIGNYFKGVINNMVKIDFINKWYITVSNKKYLQNLDPWVANKIIVLEDEAFSPANFNTRGYEANKEFTERLEQVTVEHNIDAYWNPNPVMVNVLFPINKLDCEMYITFYDLIPYVFKKKYLDQWPDTITNEYKRRLRYINSPECKVLFISEATKNDFDKYIGSEYNDCTVTFLGAESQQMYRPYTINKEKSHYSIVYVGGFDFRKNLYRAVEAFARAKNNNSNTIMDNTKFYMVCHCSEQDRNDFDKFLDKLGMKDEVILTGYVSDEELAQMYNMCDLFFFPSIYEGFGLPILEALLAGCYIVTGDNSSLPEVGKEYAKYCNAEDIEDMSQKLYKGLLEAVKEDSQEKEKRKQYALEFTWERTAEQTLNFIHEVANTILVSEVKEKIKVAIVAPWPPQQTGIASFISRLLPYLSQWMDIDLYVDDSKIKLSHYQKYKDGNMYSIEKLYSNKDNYVNIIYHLGNNSEFHTRIYEVALEIPGIVEIHDYIIHPFMYHSFYLTNKKHVYKQSLEYYGEKGLKHYEEVINHISDPDMYKYPMIEYISSMSKGIIVHSRWVADQMKGIDNISVIPLPSFDKVIEDSQFNQENFYKKYNVQENEYIIGCMGFVNKNKRPEVILRAVSKLKEVGYPIKLIFFGKAGDYEQEIRKLAKELNIDKNIVITGFTDEYDYFEGISFTDIIINLRYPSMGESSATLCEAFKYGKPVIVSNVNQYKEYPDEICWKVDMNEEEVSQLIRYIKLLLKEENVRKIVGENANNYSEGVLNIDKIAVEYYNLLKQWN